MWWFSLIGRLAKGIDKWQAKKLDAKTESERIQAQAMIDKLTNQMEAQTRGKATWLPKVVRAALVLPFGIFIWKVVVFDKVLALGSTDDLSPQLWNVFYIMLGFYFLYDVAGRLKK